MLAFQILAEQRIQEAIKNGEFDNLPNKGKPLVFEDMSGIPPELRAGFKILKNSGVLPEEMQLKKEIAGLEELLNSADLNPKDEESLKKKLVNKIIHYRTIMEKKK